MTGDAPPKRDSAFAKVARAIGRGPTPSFSPRNYDPSTYLRLFDFILSGAETDEERECFVAMFQNLRQHFVHVDFSAAKALAFGIFDSAGVPRPYVKQSPYRAARISREHELFLPRTVTNFDVTEQCALLLLGVREEPEITASQYDDWFINWLASSRATNQYPSDLLDECLTQTRQILNIGVLDFVVGRASGWATMQPGQHYYDIARFSGCEVQHRTECHPLRIPGSSRHTFDYTPEKAEERRLNRLRELPAVPKKQSITEIEAEIRKLEAELEEELKRAE